MDTPKLLQILKTINGLETDVQVDTLISDGTEIPSKLLIENKQEKNDKTESVGLKEVDSTKDEEYVRGNMIKTIETSMAALQALSELAESSSHPRAYEVLTSLIKETMSANKELLDVHKEKNKEKEAKTPQKVTNNAIFVGSTNALLEALKENRKTDDS